MPARSGPAGDVWTDGGPSNIHVPPRWLAGQEEGSRKRRAAGARRTARRTVRGTVGEGIGVVDQASLVGINRVAWRHRRAAATVSAGSIVAELTKAKSEIVIGRIV